jgi:superfamily II DNA or RNA helicase
MDKFINGDAVGLGKTVDVVAAAAWLKQRKPDYKVVIVTTKSTAYQWRDEFLRFSYLRPYVMRDSYRGQTSSEARYAQMESFFHGDKKDVMIVKYDSIKGTKKKVKGGKEAENSDVKFFTKIFKENKDRLILVFDECHKFKGTGTAVRNLVFSISRCADKTWGLTATVMKNSLNEFYAVATALGICPFGFMPEFVEEFCIMRPQYIGAGRKKMVLVGYQNIAKFKAGIRPFFLGRSQRQVKEPLPRLSTTYHPLDLTDQQIDLLEDIKNGVFILPPALIKDASGDLHECERDVDNLMTQLSVQQLVANHPGMLDPANTKEFFTTKLSPKEEALLDMLDGDLAGEKVICFAQPLDAKILTPFGWRFMGDLHVGDEVVDPDTGLSAFVEGVFPQGVKSTYRVTTVSGAKTEATGDHLWLMQSATDRNRNLGWRIRTTEQILHKGLQRRNKNGSSINKAFLPVPVPSQFNSGELLPIPAYTLGVLLGDGDIVNGAIFGVQDDEIALRVEGECPPDMRLARYGKGHYRLSTNLPYPKDEHGYNIEGANAYVRHLRQLGLFGCYSHMKFIPDAYKKATMDDRLSLLQGLLDTDGCCTKLGYVNFRVTSKTLATDIAEVVRSLGGLASFHEDKPTPSYYDHGGTKKQGKDTWSVCIRMSVNPFSIKRKVEKWNPHVSIYNPIKSIEYAGEKKCQCIRVSSKRSLYITDDYIVTHNTKYKMWIDRMERLTKDGNFTDRKFLRITGNENEKQRNDNKRLFQGSPDHNLIVVNAAGIEGINLQQAAHLICLDLPWSWGDLIQLVGRMVRMASPHTACTLHILVAKGTIDEYTIETLRGKKGIFEQILGKSHSAGILDEGIFLDLDSGMEAGNSDEEYRSLLKAHVKSVGVKKFLDGDKIEEARDNEDYQMIFQKRETSRRKKRSDLPATILSKWGKIEEV